MSTFTFSDSDSASRKSHSIHPDELKALEEATRNIRLRGGGDPGKLVAGVIPDQSREQTLTDTFRRRVA